MKPTLTLMIVVFSTNLVVSQKWTGCENVWCPSSYNGYSINRPNPYRCDSFCRCNWGKATSYKCPPGLHFNQKLEMCDWPHSANCYRAENTKPAPNTSIQSGNKCGGVYCPAINSGLAIHKPNPGDCCSFCKCDWGKPVWFACPRGLHFNPVREVCDWPRNAGCNAANGGLSTIPPAYMGPRTTFYTTIETSTFSSTFPTPPANCSYCTRDDRTTYTASTPNYRPPSSSPPSYITWDATTTGHDTVTPKPRSTSGEGQDQPLL